MTTLHLKKSMGRSPSRLGLLLIPVVFACFALAQSAQAVGPEPNEGDLIGNVTEEDNAVLELSTDTVEAAMGQADDNPNKRVIPIIIEKKNLQCAGGKVILKGDVIVTFKAVILNGVRVVQPIGRLKMERFSGFAVNNGIKRKLAAKNLKPLGGFTIEGNKGFFNFRFEVTGPKIGAGSPLLFVVKYRPNVYTFENGEVTEMFPDKKPNVQCCEGFCP
jgi:hypothetical protein